jgi:hypothetical protein
LETIWLGGRDILWSSKTSVSILDSIIYPKRYGSPWGMVKEKENKTTNLTIVSSRIASPGPLIRPFVARGDDHPLAWEMS